MATSFVYCIKVANDSPTPIRVVIEPWADEFIVEPTHELDIAFDGPQPGEVVANYIEDGLQLYGFNGSSAVVKRAGTVIWEAHQRLPM